MVDKEKMGTGSRLISTIIAFAVVIVAFYGLDHLIMGMQGLPLNIDLTPKG